MTNRRRQLLMLIASEPVAVQDLTRRERSDAAALYAAGCVTLKSTLNTARLSITRLGREKLAFHEQPAMTHAEALEHIQREVARVVVRDTLGVKHRLSQPQHEQRRPNAQRPQGPLPELARNERFL